MKRPKVTPFMLPVFVGAAALMLQACSGNAEKESVDPIEDLGLVDEGEAIETAPLSDSGGIKTEILEPVPSPSEEQIAAAGDSGALASPAMTVYFGYDAVNVAPEYMEVIERVVAKLKQKRSLRVRLEGHTDERGSRAYNLALGERRVQSVMDMVLERGIFSEQIHWLSYGEEIPATVGHTESAWSKNRRVEIILEE